MLFLLQQLAAQFPFELRVVHFNHAQRGTESDEDAAFVQRHCETQRIPFYLGESAELTPGASEDALRQARYAWFDSVLSKHTHAKIATAHHLDDQLETFLMRLDKGATLKGLRGIPLQRPGYIRPMLGWSRTEIDAYAAANSIPFREDASNARPDYLRNRIRLEVVPALRSVFGDSFLKGFEKSLRELNGAWETVSTTLQQRFTAMAHSSGGRITLSRAEYHRLNAFERRALLEYCIFTLNPLTFSVSEKFWLSFERFVKTARVGARFNVTEQLTVFKNRDAFTFVAGQTEIQSEVQLFPDQMVQWNTCRLLVEAEQRGNVRLNTNPFEEYFCADRVHFPLTVRSWQPGDRFKPLGMNGFKKVSNFFVDTGTERHEKAEVPVVCNGDAIVWLAGMRLDERFKLTENCEHIFKIVMKKGI